MVKDHLGNEFKTKKEMCEYWDIYLKTFEYRINKKWTLKDALTVPVSIKFKPKWTDKEIEILKEKYPTCGVKIPELAHFNRNTIYGKANSLGLTFDKNNKWTEKEIEILKEKYPIYGANIPELTYRGKYNIRNKAIRLGVKCRDSSSIFTDKEVEILKEKFPIYGADIPELSHKKRRTIFNKAYKLGLKQISKQNKWTDKEIEILKEKYPTCGTNIPELSNRSKHSIRTKARHLKIFCRNISLPHHWTKEEIKTLKEKYPTCGANIPELLNSMKRQTITSKAYSIGLATKYVDKHIWTDEEIKILKEEYPINGSAINRLAHISKKSIKTKARKLGIKNNVALYKLGRREMFNCGLKATIIECNNNNLVNIKFDDGEIKNNIYYYNFLNRSVKHPIIKSPGWFEYKGFKAKRLLRTDTETLYTCECQKCKELFPNEKNKYRFVMNPYQMMEHEKLHKGE